MFEVLIHVVGDVFCVMFVEEECTTKQPCHLENINDMQAEYDTLHTAHHECKSLAIVQMNRLSAMHTYIWTCDMQMCS